MAGARTPATGTASGGAGAGAARRPSLLDKEDLSKSGGWTRDASGHLVPPKKAEPEPAPKTPEKATGNPPAARPGPATKPRRTGSGRHPSVSVGPASVPLPGTPAGVLLALVLYPAGLAALRGGPQGLKNWFLAKFFNKVPGGPSVNASAWSTPLASTTSAINAALSSSTPTTTQTAAFSTAGAPTNVQPVVAYALAQVGKPYKWAAAGPNAFDCSGLVSAAYKQIGVTLPHYSMAIMAMGTPISPTDPAKWVAGDVLCPFTGHVEIYDGAGGVIQAWSNTYGPGSTGVVKHTSAARSYMLVKRFVNTSAGSVTV